MGFQTTRFVVNLLGIIHLELARNFSKNYYFLTPDTHTYLCKSPGEKIYREILLTYEVNDPLLSEYVDNAIFPGLGNITIYFC